MDDLNKLELQKVMKRRMPDLSYVKPPTKHAVYAMIRNLHAAAKKKT